LRVDTCALALRTSGRALRRKRRRRKAVTPLCPRRNGPNIGTFPPYARIFWAQRKFFLGRVSRSPRALSQISLAWTTVDSAPYTPYTSALFSERPPHKESPMPSIVQERLHKGYAQSMELKGKPLADEKSQYQ